MIQSTAFLFVFLTHIWFHPANGGDIHSLTYMYTAFSKPINQPGIHQFTAMGLLDGRMIDYYDSTIKKKVPKQPWMEERLDKDYWDKGTQSRQSKEQWFKVNLDILKERNGHKNDTALHILQWRHGCTAERKEDNSLKFISGMDEYGYDGDDYLAFDDANKRWNASVSLAEPTKRKWDEVKMLNDYTQGYLERECVNTWLTKFVEYGQAQLLASNRTEVHVYDTKSKKPDSLILHCMATGFLPKDVTLNIRRNGQVVNELDGIQSTGVRPNGDGTHQIKMHMEIQRSDPSIYKCEVKHPTSKMYEVKDWDVSLRVTSDDSGSNGGDIHSLTYIYTALSKPINQPGIHEFTAMGLLDGRMIDYYDSTIKKKVPKQPWMREKLGEDYWYKGTRSRQSKEQWFKVNLDILKERNGHKNDTALHILQWRHGCTAERKEDNSLKFISGMDEYGYDGDDYLAFDDANKRWNASVPLAEPTKRKWDEVKMLNDYTQGYLERECVNTWLTKFVEYGQAQLLASSPPDVHVYDKKSKNPLSLILHCMATGFLPKDVTLNIRRNGQEVNELDGIQSTGVRPNGDGTHQIKMHMEIQRSDPSIYNCEVKHPASKMYEVKDWDVSKCLPFDDSGSNIGAIVGVLVVLGILVGVSVLIMKTKKVGCFSGEPEGRNIESGELETLQGKGSVENVDGKSEAQGSRNGDSNPESTSFMGGDEPSD